jgi:hypothetical protein
MLKNYKIKIKTDLWWTYIDCLEKINHNWEVLETLDFKDIAKNDQLIEKLNKQLIPCDEDFFIMPRRDLEPETIDEKIIWCEIGSLELANNEDLSFMFNAYMADKQFSANHFIYLLTWFMKHKLWYTSKLYKANFWKWWKSEVAQYKRLDVMKVYKYLSEHQQWLLNNHYKK